jgi:hypothetical protein
MVLLNSPLNSDAQQTSFADSIAKNSSDSKSYSFVSTNYNSDIVFLGRKSSSKAPYVSAFAGYYDKSGLFINGGASYLAASGGKRIDLFTLTTGYSYSLKSFNAGINGTKYFFNSKSTTVKSELSGYVNVYADYDFDIVDVYVDGTVYFSNTTDFILGAIVSHVFYAAKDNLNIIPAFSVYAGTQNYYSNYNNNLRFGRHMLGGGGSPSTGTGMMGAGNFNVLDYELSVAVSYSIKKFRFLFTPVYAMPVNPATIANNQNTYKEDISNTFFWSLGARYKIF